MVDLHARLVDAVHAHRRASYAHGFRNRFASGELRRLSAQRSQLLPPQDRREVRIYGLY